MRIGEQQIISYGGRGDIANNYVLNLGEGLSDLLPKFSLSLFVKDSAKVVLEQLSSDVKAREIIVKLNQLYLNGEISLSASSFNIIINSDCGSNKILISNSWLREHNFQGLLNLVTNLEEGNEEFYNILFALRVNKKDKNSNIRVCGVVNKDSYLDFSQFPDIFLGLKNKDEVSLHIAECVNFDSWESTIESLYKNGLLEEFLKDQKDIFSYRGSITINKDDYVQAVFDSVNGARAFLVRDEGNRKSLVHIDSLDYVVYKNFAITKNIRLFIP